MNNKAPKYGKILGTKISGTSEDQVIKYLLSSLTNNHKFFVTTPNPEIVVAAQNDVNLKKAINSSDIALPDGIGVLWAVNGKRLPGRVMMLKIFKLASEKGLKIFLLGSSKEVNRDSVNKLKKKYPNLKAIGESGPMIDSNAKPVSEVDIKIQKDTINSINKFKPDILFVAFGAPKQEKWIHNNLQKLKIGGAMTVGGALDYFSGKAVPPPKWMESIGLEWLWRALTQPWRIKRIFRAVIIFPLLVLRAKFSR